MRRNRAISFCSCGLWRLADASIRTSIRRKNTENAPRITLDLVVPSLHNHAGKSIARGMSAMTVVEWMQGERSSQMAAPVEIPYPTVHIRVAHVLPAFRCGRHFPDTEAIPRNRAHKLLLSLHRVPRRRNERQRFLLRRRADRAQLVGCRPVHHKLNVK